MTAWWSLRFGGRLQAELVPMLLQDVVVETMTETRRENSPLTALDRCDGCSAAAAVRLRMPSGLDLLMCKHHHRKNASALSTQGAEIEETASG
jgi:hypothetical protein